MFADTYRQLIADFVAAHRYSDGSLPGPKLVKVYTDYSFIPGQDPPESDEAAQGENEGENEEQGQENAEEQNNSDNSTNNENNENNEGGSQDGNEESSEEQQNNGEDNE